MMPEVWSIAAATDGISLCAMRADAARRVFYAPFRLKAQSELTVIDPGDVARCLADVLSAMLRSKIADNAKCNSDLKNNSEFHSNSNNNPQENAVFANDAINRQEERGIALPLAIALVSPHRRTALCTDANGAPQSPIYLDMPLPVARRDVPDRFRNDDILCYAFRACFVRRLRNMSPEACLKPLPGIGTLGSYIAYLLTGHWRDGCDPLGIPDMFWKCGGRNNIELSQALGIDWDASFRSARSLAPFARISPYIAERIAQSIGVPDKEKIAGGGAQTHALPDARFAMLAGIPVYALGSIDAARAFASNADPIRWSAKIGYDLRAHWNAKRFACADIEISIQNNPQNAEENSDSKELTAGVGNASADINADNTNISKPAAGEDSACFAEKPPKPRDCKEPPKPRDCKEPTKPRDCKEPPEPHDCKEPTKPRDCKEPPKPHDCKEPPEPHDCKEPPEPHDCKEPPRPQTCEEWTRAWSEHFALDIAPGLKPTETAFGFSGSHMRSLMPAQALDAIAQNGGVYPFAALRRAQAGAAGLHIVSAPNGNTAVGLRPGHGVCHWMRAVFEAMVFELRAKREKMPDVARAPISVLLCPPWPDGCAQWIADILDAPIRLISGSEAEHAAVGAAVFLMRHLGLPAPPTAVGAQIIEPSKRAEIYRAHFDIHCALCDELT